MGFRAKKEKAQEAFSSLWAHVVLSMEHAGMMGSKGVYVGGYLH